MARPKMKPAASRFAGVKEKMAAKKGAPPAGGGLAGYIASKGKK